MCAICAQQSNVSKEICVYVKRDILTYSQEKRWTYVKRDMTRAFATGTTIEIYTCAKRDLHVCEKRPIHTKRDLQMWKKT